jgi:SAM-dependent methyltransferase
MIDESNGYDNVAEIYIKGRGRAVNGIGSSTARAWARTLTIGSAVLDLGCGNGIPVTKILLEAGLKAHAVDASPKMVVDFQQNFPNVPVACESVERSPFFNRTFDGIISIGMMFLLSEENQRALIPKIAAALNPGGKLLFTAPLDKVEWKDVMTGQLSRSLGAGQYRELILASGLSIGEEFDDEGGNHYFSGVRIPDYNSGNVSSIPMDIEQIDISSKPIKVFLDSVDTVLNSNTFLLQFEVTSDNISTELLDFIRSESFIKQLANQDKERGWFNMHYYDHKTNSYKLRHGNILKDRIELKVKEIENEKSEYLIAMLTGDTSKGRFFSFHSKTNRNKESGSNS